MAKLYIITALKATDDSSLRSLIRYFLEIFSQPFVVELGDAGVTETVNRVTLVGIEAS